MPERKLTEDELADYFYEQLIEGIRELAMDYEVQLTLIPFEIHGALAHELIDDFSLFFEGRVWPIEAGLISKERLEKIEELNYLIDKVIDKNLLTQDAVQNSNEWEEIRLFSRKVLDIMNEEIRKPALPRGKWRGFRD